MPEKNNWREWDKMAFETGIVTASAIILLDVLGVPTSPLWFLLWIAWLAIWANAWRLAMKSDDFGNPY